MREADAARGVGDLQVHLVRVFDRFQNLFLERARASVPEERASVAPIDERGRVATSDAPEDADGNRAAVREGALGIVTGEQAIEPSRERPRSLNNRRPSSIFWTVRGLSSGTGM